MVALATFEVFSGQRWLLVLDCTDAEHFSISQKALGTMPKRTLLLNPRNAIKETYEMHHGLKIKPHLCILWGAVKAMKYPQYPSTACVNLLKQLEHTLFLFTLFCGCFSLPPPPFSISFWWSYVPYVILLQVQNCFFQSWMQLHMCNNSSEGQRSITANPGLSRSLWVNSVLLCLLMLYCLLVYIGIIMVIYADILYA